MTANVRSRRQLTRRGFTRTPAAAGPLLLNSCAAPLERPNVIFILTDDQRWDQMGCAGHPHLETPNMDRLASEGTRFTNAFVTTSLCSPARASFLTGRYTHAHGIVGNRVEPPDSEMRRAFPALLQRAGYETAYFGKFHMGRDPGPRPGFDEWAVLPGQGRYVDPIFNVNGETKTLPGHSGAVTTDMALEWIERRREKPFCLVLGFKEPHGPRTPPEHLKNLYADVEVPQPSPEPEHLRGKPAAVRERRRPAFVRNRAERTPEQYAEDRRNYWRCITAADEQIGRVLDSLDQSGLSQNTLVVFAGDNGYFLGEFGLGDKRYGYALYAFR